jgi:predicted ribosome quality control (RQC) complex YloA/Tae2 family protein
MYFDALTLAAVADELRAIILDGRVQRARLPSRLSVALEIYAHGRRQHLLLSAHPQWTRAHLCVAKPSRGVERDTPLLLLLRKYVVGGRIVAIEQPALERVLILSIAKGPHARNIGPHPLADPHPPAPSLVATGEGENRLAPPAAGEGLGVRAWADEEADLSFEEGEELVEPLRCELIVEAMERRGNIVLVGDDNIILESARHITPRMSRRPVQPREPYELPPAQEKRDPRHATAEGIRALLDDNAAAAPLLSRALVGAYRGLSPLAAREAAFRATGQPDPPLAPDMPWEQIAASVRELWSAPWQPCLVFDAGEPVAFAPYALTHLAPFEAQPATSAALELFYAARERLSSHEQRRDAVRQQLLDARERLDRQRRLLGVELERAQDLERLRWEGEMIYGFLHAIRPGQTALEVDGRSIALDPARTPAENAQERFHAYDKAKGAQAGVPDRLRAVEARLAGLDETLALLELAEGFEAIEGMAREATDQGYLREPEAARKRQKIRPQPPLRIESADGLTIYVGRSAGQNERVTFTLGGPDDLWLHARGIPGAHVIIKSGGRAVPERTLLEAAALAAYFSKGRDEAGVDVEIARRALVRRVPGGPPGLVTYRAERALRVAPRAPW